MKRLSCFFLATFIGLYACKSRQSAQPVLSQPNKVPQDFHFSLQKTVCFGQCPAYRIEVDANGRLKWLGEHFVYKIGNYSRVLSSQELEKLYERLQAARLDQYERVYDDSGISDLPTTKLEYTAGGKRSQIICRYKCPSVLINLFRELEQLADTTGMVPYKDSRSETTE